MSPSYRTGPRSDTTEVLTLTRSQAASLEALRVGFDNKTRVALEAGLGLKEASAALRVLQQAGLAEHASRYRWHLTRAGQSCPVQVVSDAPRQRGGRGYCRVVPGSTAARLLNELTQPMSGAELASRLGVTRQRVHQLVVRLHALGRLRVGDKERPLHIIARGDDPSILLNRDGARILSALPDEYATTAPRIAAVTGMPARRTNAALMCLHQQGLIEDVGTVRKHRSYRLTATGAAHVQRRPSARHAEPAPLKVQSERVRSVLSVMADRGPLRIRDVRDSLSLPQASMNALMQYLKRRGLVRKVSSDGTAPYELTDDGRRTLAEMIRRGP